MPRPALHGRHGEHAQLVLAVTRALDEGAARRHHGQGADDRALATLAVGHREQDRLRGARVRIAQRGHVGVGDVNERVGKVGERGQRADLCEPRLIVGVNDPNGARHAVPFSVIPQQGQCTQPRAPAATANLSATSRAHRSTASGTAIGSHVERETP